MLTSVIYKHPSEDCPLCLVDKKGDAATSEGDPIHTHRCSSVYVSGSNTHGAMWVLRCEEKYKRCPGFRYHNKLLKYFKRALLETSKKISIGRIVALPKLIRAMVLPKMNKDSMYRQEPQPLKNLTKDRSVEVCLSYYGFTSFDKTKKNRKKKMWKITEDWFVRKS